MGIFWAVKVLRWNVWVRRAAMAEKKVRTTDCAKCEGLIIPGDLVAEIWKDEREEETIITHAGIHFSKNEINAFCDIGFFSRTGKWNGKDVSRIGEPLPHSSRIALQISRTCCA